MSTPPQNREQVGVELAAIRSGPVFICIDAQRVHNMAGKLCGCIHNLALLDTMLNFDSLTLQFPMDCIKGFDPNIYTEAHNSKGLHTFTLERSASGLSKRGAVKIDQAAKQVTMAMSSKILADNMLHGISLTTIEQAISTALQVASINADPCDIITMSRVLNIDCTKNLRLPFDNNPAQHIEIIDSLYAARSNPRFAGIPYKVVSKNMGMEYSGLHKTEKNRLIFYYKQVEMGKRNKANRDFFATCRNHEKVYSDMANILRCELNNTSFSSMRDRFKVKDNTLTELLTSSARPNLDMFLKITGPDPAPLLELMNEYNPEQHTFEHIVEMEGLKTILQLCGHNPAAVRTLIKRYTRNDSHFRSLWTGRVATKKYAGRTGYNKLIRQLKQSEVMEGKPLQIIEAIKQHLAA